MMEGVIPLHEATRRREFLLLQGLAGPFFARLGDALDAAGQGVHRIIFNGGDRAFWRGRDAIAYRGGLRRWPAFLQRHLLKRGITDIVLFGDCRPLHKEAIFLANRLGLAVHVFEEGYIRPDWVTLEAGGVNGLSSLPRNPEYYLDAASSLPPLPPAAPPVPFSFKRRAFEDILYNFAGMAMAPLFPGYRTHRPWHPLVEYMGWLSRLVRGSAARRRSALVKAELEAHQRPYFVFPLQLDCDYQIRVHSPFKGIADAIDHVFESFAAHADPNALLVVKSHPLDNGLRNWKRVALETAKRTGLSDRMLYLEDADIALLVRDAQGVVTVNSTTGTLALAHGVPVATLGRAVYDIPRVTHQGGLDSFWTAPDVHEPAVFDALRRVLIDRCLIQGGFFSDEGLDMLVRAAIPRLMAGGPVYRTATAMTIANQEEPGFLVARTG